jgi:hypothetical protein
MWAKIPQRPILKTPFQKQDARDHGGEYGKLPSPRLERDGKFPPAPSGALGTRTRFSHGNWRCPRTPGSAGGTTKADPPARAQHRGQIRISWRIPCSSSVLWDGLPPFRKSNTAKNGPGRPGRAPEPSVSPQGRGIFVPRRKPQYTSGDMRLLRANELV